MATSMVKRNNGNQPMTFENVVDNVFRNSLSRFFDDDFWGIDRNFSRRQVPVNMRETENSYELEVIAPGRKKEDFKINLDGNMLTISFEHSTEKKQEGKENSWVRNEYSYESFSRSFTLDDTVSADKIEAKYADGVLRLSLPKNEKAKSKATRLIEVK